MLSDYMKPILGTFLGQLDSSISCQLNGVTWFLLSLFAMHWITDFCNRQRHGKVWMLSISIIAMILYGANKNYHFAPYLPFHGLVRCIPFYFLGNIASHYSYLKMTCLKRDFIIGSVALILSLILFYFHIEESRIIIHITLYFIVCFFSIIAIIHFWRCLDKFKYKIILYISIGTMVIFGLHRLLIGIIDYTIEKILNLSDICYSLQEAVIIAIGLELILLPFIFYCKKHWPILLGKKKAVKIRSFSVPKDHA